ncbi:MAG: CPBP family intramembrane metalloprotease [Oscillospiraceae bacterium]|nr:CPBP family intramembrane metalloprotease [Oscillospiraceae bacterium]
MKNFLSGRANKIALALIIFFLPIIIIAASNIKDSVHVSHIAGAVLSILYLLIIKKQGNTEKLTHIRNTSGLFMIFAIVISAGLTLLPLLLLSKIGAEIEFEKELGVTAVISGCIVAPIVEELFFRYVLSELWFHEIDESRKEWIKLTVIGSLMWSLSHLNYLGSNVAMGIFIFFNGLLLYYILFRTRNIIYTIIIHAVNNLLTTILLPLTWNSIVKATGNNAVFIVITVLLTAAFVFCFYRISKNNTSDKKLETADNI